MMLQLQFNDRVALSSCNRPINSSLVDWAFEYYLKKALPKQEGFSYAPRLACGSERGKSSAEIELEFVSFLHDSTHDLV
ncbi:MAG: Transposase [Pseudomonas helleri]|jgi:hypothetical protein|uniref:Uncharacterized protein n=2 Tax=Pseudomonas helleri TaxID=1608996 RepID=A0A6A7ZH19_9PSED|nr:hypothetical protein [Pseudomonas helleri]MQU24840.1 hypothetical protein [Pseudomonas helleri]MQU46302.1 hypothetical protein [Pseudomonas helleri]MQU61493.1 hypothetical protein [Pseudomonas helleri]